MNWIKVEDKLPEYQAQISGNKFVNILMADRDGEVWAGDYTNGEFCVHGICHPYITHYRYDIKNAPGWWNR